MDIKRFKLVDKPFVLVLIMILVYGLVILSSAGSSISNDSLFYVKKQAMWLVLGIILAILIMRYDFSNLVRYTRYLYGLSLIILIVVLVFGQEVRGVTGWISVGPLPAVQPAEFTKILLILSFAEFLSQRKGYLNTFNEMLPCFAYMGLPFLLILAQPDLGTALVYIAITLSMMFVAGANPSILLKLITGAVLAVALILFLHFKFGMWLPLDDYQIHRLTMFINPYNDGQGGRGAGWNTIQSLVAIGSGGVFGKGLFNGTQVQLNFLPEHHTDFIYAVIGEELGFIGAALVILLFGILMIRTVYIALNSKEYYGMLMVIGITAMWLFHIFENIGMSIGLMPITGIPLPFLSYGGSSMLTNLIGVGLILNVNIREKKIVF